eukprot:3618115-Rhodomonas_salina.2
MHTPTASRRGVRYCSRMCGYYQLLLRNAESGTNPYCFVLPAEVGRDPEARAPRGDSAPMVPSYAVTTRCPVLTWGMTVPW